MKQLFTIPEAAALLGVSRNRMWRFVHDGRLHVAFWVGRAEKNRNGLALIAREELERFRKIPRVSGRPKTKKLKRKERTS